MKAAPRGSVVGLDIGRHAVRAAWIELRGAAPVVSRLESLRLPADGADSTGVIFPWLEQIKLGRTPCVVALSGDQCMFQPLRLQPNDPRSLKQAAEMEVIQFNEMSSETMAYAYAPIELNPVEQRLILAMARPSLLERVLDTSNTLGIRVVDVVPAPVALFNALGADAQDPERPNLLVNIGRLTTNVAIGSSAGLLFARSFSTGGQLFTDAIARSAGLASSQAEILKADEATLGDESQPYAADLSRAGGMWSGELQACLSVFQSLYPEASTKPARAILSGGGAALRGLPEHLATMLRMDVERLETLPLVGAVEEPSEYAIAIGLGISGHAAAAVDLSLLPDQMRAEQVFRTQKPHWIAAGIVAALVLGVTVFGGYRDLRRSQAKLRTHASSLKKRETLVQEIETTRRGIELSRKMAAPVGELLGTGPMMRDIITLVATCMDTRDWLTMICDGHTYFSVKRANKDVPDGEGPLLERHAVKEGRVGFERVILEGYTPTRDLSTVKALIARLETTNFVASADLLYDDMLTSEAVATNVARDVAARRFVIDLEVAQ